MGFGSPKFFVPKGAVWHPPVRNAPAPKMPSIPKISSGGGFGSKPPPKAPSKPDPLTDIKLARAANTTPTSFRGGDSKTPIPSPVRTQPGVYANPPQGLPPNTEEYAYQEMPPPMRVPRMKPQIGPRYDPVAFGDGHDEYEERRSRSVFQPEKGYAAKEGPPQRKAPADSYDEPEGEYREDYIGKPKAMVASGLEKATPKTMVAEGPVEKLLSGLLSLAPIKRIQDELGEEPRASEPTASDEIPSVEYAPSSKMKATDALATVEW